MEIHSWEEAGDWSSKESLSPGSVFPCLEALRLALVERAELFGVDCGSLAQELRRPGSLRETAEQMKELFEEILPRFPRVEGNPAGEGKDEESEGDKTSPSIARIHFTPHSPGAESIVLESVDTDSFQQVFQSGDSAFTETHSLSIGNGHLKVESEALLNAEKGENFRPLRLEFEKWDLDDFYALYGEIPLSPLTPVSDFLWKMHCHLRRLWMPYSVLQWDYEDRESLETYIRGTTHFWYFTEILYTSPDGMKIHNSNPGGFGNLPMHAEDVWALSDWMRNETDTFYTEALYYQDGSLGDGYFEHRTMRSLYRTSFLNRSHAEPQTALPLKFKRDSYLECVTEGDLFVPEIGAEHSWVNNLSLSLNPGERSGIYEFGNISSMPSLQSWCTRKYRSTIVGEFDLFRNTPFQFV